MKLIEDAHLIAAIEQAREAVAEADEQHLTTQGSAWWSSLRVLERFLSAPSVTYPHPSPPLTGRP